MSCNAIMKTGEDFSAAGPIRGQECSISDWPWHAAFFFLHSENPFSLDLSFLCSAIQTEVNLISDLRGGGRPLLHSLFLLLLCHAKKQEEEGLHGGLCSSKGHKRPLMSLGRRLFSTAKKAQEQMLLHTSQGHSSFWCTETLFMALILGDQ